MIRRFRAKPIPFQILIALIVLAIGLIVLGIWLNVRRPEPPHDYESCVEAGYPLLESYPEQCLYGTQGFVKGQ